MHSYFGKIIWQFITKLNIALLYNVAVMLLDSKSNLVKTYFHTKTWMRVFIKHLFVITKMETTKLSSYRLMEKNYITFIQLYKYLGIKWNNLLIHVILWKRLTWLILRERSQNQKIAYCITPFIWHCAKGNVEGQKLNQ